MKEIAVFPGSFDPFTYGHLDVVKRALKIFDKILILVLNNPRKKPFFTPEERMRIINEILELEGLLDRVSVDYYKGLMVDYLRQHEYNLVIRGLRAVSDFEYEILQAHANAKLCPEMETIFMFTSPEYSFLSSSLVKELAMFGADISKLVPEPVIKAINEKLERETSNLSGGE